MSAITMDTLKPGEEGIVESLHMDPDFKRRLYDLGFVPGTRVKCVLKAPLGNPKAFLVKHTVIALRRKDSCKITIKKLADSESATHKKRP